MELLSLAILFPVYWKIATHMDDWYEALVNSNTDEEESTPREPGRCHCQPGALT